MAHAQPVQWAATGDQGLPFKFSPTHTRVPGVRWLLRGSPEAYVVCHGARVCAGPLNPWILSAR